MTIENKELTLDQLDQASGGRVTVHHRPAYVSPRHAFVVLNKQINASIEAALKSFGSLHPF